MTGDQFDTALDQLRAAVVAEIRRQNQLTPCPSRAARIRHAAHGQDCDVCDNQHDREAA